MVEGIGRTMQREAGGSGSLIDGLACGQRFRAAVPVLRRFAQTVRPEPAQRPTVGSDRNVGGRWNFLSGCVHGRLLSMGSSPNGAHLRSVCQALIQTRLTSPEAICRPCQWLSQRSADRASGRHSSSVALIAVTTDPRGDGPTDVRHFLQRYGLESRMTYLVGDRRALTTLWDFYYMFPGDEAIRYGLPRGWTVRSGRQRTRALLLDIIRFRSD